MAPLHELERQRLRELDQYGVFGTPPESDYDHICRLTADIFEVPIAMINLVARDTVWVKSRIGVDLQEVPRELTFCHHTIQGHDLLVVPDLTNDQRFCGNPLVTSPEGGLRFYAGAPLSTPKGYVIGTLCILDRQPRAHLSPKERERLKNLAVLVMDRLEKRRLEQLELMTSSLMNATSDGIIITDAAHNIRYWNHAAETIFGFTPEEMTEKPVTAITTDQKDAALLVQALEDVADGHRSVSLTLATRAKGGRAISTEVSFASWGTGTSDKEEGPLGFGLIVRDVTEQTAVAEKLAWLARHDELTGMFNRNHLRQVMNDALAARDSIAVVSINLDRFMAINDTFGHRVGDALLKVVTRRLEKELGPTDLLARIGGDEFTILRSGPTDRAELECLASRLQAAFGETFAVDGHLVTTTASVGIATSELGEANTDALLNAADLAIYRAKSDGGNGWRFFTPEHDSRISVVRSMENDLRGALSRGEFALNYQPKFCLVTGRLTGAEALLRWTHPAKGAVSPADFIPVAELSGLIVPIGEWVLATACNALTRLPGDFRMAVNLSPVQFRRSDVAATVADKLLLSGINPARLEVEITESLLLENSPATAGALEALKALGVSIALDDFGTGYSSLAYLCKFPFDTIKIDRSFVQTLETEPGSAAIVRAVVGLGRDFSLKVIAEGVETDAQKRMLLAFGCDEGQGYLLGRPMPLEALLQIAVNTGSR